MIRTQVQKKCSLLTQGVGTPISSVLRVATRVTTCDHPIAVCDHVFTAKLLVTQLKSTITAIYGAIR